MSRPLSIAILQGDMKLKTRLISLCILTGTKTNTMMQIIIHALNGLHFDKYPVRRVDSAVRKRKKEHKLMKRVMSSSI